MTRGVSLPVELWERVVAVQGLINVSRAAQAGILAEVERIERETPTAVLDYHRRQGK